MTKSDIITQICEEHGISKAAAGGILDTVFNTIVDGLSEAGGEVKITGFGKFMAVHMPERKARNPRTGEQVTVPERTVVKFKPLGDLKKKMG